MTRQHICIRCSGTGFEATSKYAEQVPCNACHGCGRIWREDFEPADLYLLLKAVRQMPYDALRRLLDFLERHMDDPEFRHDPLEYAAQMGLFNAPRRMVRGAVQRNNATKGDG